MRELWNKIAAAITRLHPRSRPVENRRQVPRFICCCAVSWESGSLRGEGELRELSSTGMRLRTDHAVLAGKSIRILPLAVGPEQPLPLDMVFGTVVYSKNRKGKVDIGIELLNPERISRFAWFHQLRREGPDPRTGSPLPSILPTRAGLRLVGAAPPKSPSRID